MSEILRIQDLSPEEIAELLAENGSRIAPQQAAALRAFVADVGGIEQACAALEMLGELEQAA